MEAARINNGYSVCAGWSDEGWYAGVYVLQDDDYDFIKGNKQKNYDEQVRYWRSWNNAVGQSRRINLVFSKDGEIKQQNICHADRIIGPVCPKERTNSHFLAWIEKVDNGWNLMSYSNGKKQVIKRQKGIMRSPQVAFFKGKPVYSVEREDNGTCVVVVLTDKGKELHRFAGCKPRLVSGDDYVVLLSEKRTVDSIILELRYIRDNSLLKECCIAEGDYCLNADISWLEKEKCAYVVAESSPSFGYGNNMGSHRTIHLWKAVDGSIEQFPQIPVEQSSFSAMIHSENRTPIKPKVIFDKQRPVVLFKQFRYFKHKTFGWDVLCTDFDGKTWSKPKRLTGNLTGSDSSFELLNHNDKYISFFPAHENAGRSSRSYDFRVEIAEFSKEDLYDIVPVPEDAAKNSTYIIPNAYKNIAPPPPDLPDPYAGRTLIWGDLHVHTIYSQCVAAVDGNPEENLRFYRDVFGCQVFTLTEHTPWITGPHSTWAYDQLEQIAGDNAVILYGAEPSMRYVRHTNWYAKNRQTFDRLQRAFIVQNEDLPNTLRHVREEFCPGEVMMMRHFHGAPIPDEQIMQSFDPQLEFAMESMQGRCNAMLNSDNGFDKAPLFPTPFLNAGCKVGLVGGTDHYRTGPNHHCLTGFWVKDISVDGVWEAIRNRYTIAMSDSKVAMVTRMNGFPMGEPVIVEKASDINIQIQAGCGHKIRRITLIRDGEVLPWKNVNANFIDMELNDQEAKPGRHWYVPTVEVETVYGKNAVGYCHASPFFVMINS